MKITKKLSALLLVAVLSIGMASAQVGFQAGYSSFKGNHKDSDALKGFHVGATYDMSIQGPVGIHYGLLYNFAQFSEDKLVERTVNFHSIDVPVRLALNYPVGNKLTISAFAGPNFNYGLSFKSKIKSKLGEATHNAYDDDYSRFNLQLGGGLGIQYGRVGLKASYDLGLLKLVKDADDSKVNAFKVGIFYNF